jgi:pimeloyl-ACP methyl ester carboxylesterase
MAGKISAGPGETIYVNGRAIHLVRRGTTSKAREVPTFVLEAACGWHSAMYAWLIEALPEHGAVLVYDRAGLGRSEPSGALPDGESRAQELQAVIETLGLKGPFVLIGHSIAALYLRIYAHRRREDVLGLVFLDGTHPLAYKLFKERTPLGERILKALALSAYRVGVSRLPYSLLRETDPPWNALPKDAQQEIAYLSTQTAQWATERAERAMQSAASQQARARGTLGDTPLLVITAGTRTPEELQHAEDPEVFMDKWMLLQRDLVSLSMRGIHRTIEGAGHRSLVTDRRYALQVCSEIACFVRIAHTPSACRVPIGASHRED